MGIINYETLLSSYDDKLTLMQWLKKVEEALKNASATAFSVNKKGNATISFSLTFEDGTSLESGDIVLQQGESVAAARIENGDLILTLTNGDELNAGNMFNGNISINGNLSTTGTFEQSLANYSADINMVYPSITGVNFNTRYNKLKVINGVMYIVLSFTAENTTASPVALYDIAHVVNYAMSLPNEYASKIIDANGNTAAEAVSPAASIAFADCLIGDNVAAPSASLERVQFGVVNVGFANSINIGVQQLGGYSLPANTTKVFSARIALTIL